MFCGNLLIVKTCFMEGDAPDDYYPCTGNRKFHGVYLLYCLNPSYKGRTYIGYTVNPQRRIKQHNLGKGGGGAWKTSGRGPWDMVLVIHGFPNDVAGLRFEWAWQHPTSSRRLKHVKRKGKNETAFDAKLRILAEMLNTGPWNRLPLTIQWLKQEYARHFPVTAQPPVHMPITYGPIKVLERRNKTNKHNVDNSIKNKLCHLCHGSGDPSSVVSCCNATCSFESHIICLAERNEEREFLLPVTIDCPKCKSKMLWGDLIYGKKQEQGEDLPVDEECDAISSQEDD